MIVRNDEVAKFLIEQSVPGSMFHPPFAGWVIIVKGEPRGAFIYNGYNGHNVDLSMSLFGSFPVSDVRAMARHGFGDLNICRCTARARPSNVKANAAMVRAGFVLESVARDHFGDEDANVYVLLRRDQRIVRL